MLLRVINRGSLLLLLIGIVVGRVDIRMWVDWILVLGVIAGLLIESVHEVGLVIK